jgi:aspartyl-tRNA(Asn)/glutamyl-tRNA(Gln) amidotransferase subunit C
MRITTAETRTTAAMARLALSDEEVERMTVELDRILDLSAQLEEVDVQGVEPTTHALPLSCPLREDLVGPHLSAELALRGAPSQEASFFAVPAIFEREPDEG